MSSSVIKTLKIAVTVLQDQMVTVSRVPQMNIADQDLRQLHFNLIHVWR